jgi:cyclomaltodextrinase
MPFSIKKIAGCVVFMFLSLQLRAATIILHARSATVWLPAQTISGEVKDLSLKQLVVHFNDSAFVIKVDSLKTFSFSVLLKNKNNLIWVETELLPHTISDTIYYELGYTPLPLVKPYATNKGNKIFLHAAVENNPYQLQLKFLWQADKENPDVIKIYDHSDSAAYFMLPQKKGDYFLNLTVIAGKDSANFRTLVIRSDSVHCFDISHDHAAWIDSLVLYEITPSIFVKDAAYSDITAKLPELHELGINAIWLQPVYKAHGSGQGYDITDYFSLRTDIGTEQDLFNLVKTAKKSGMKVLFDFVPNHTSIYHPYFLDALSYGKDSHYFDFYQRTDDGAAYSSLYEKDDHGFYHYFWKHLVNLNQNKEVQQWIMEACKYWLQKFDIDGYRLDAVWACNARDSTFGKRLQLELKSIKPDILLLAEDKGTVTNVYKLGYDAAYDWQADTAWISHWSWQYHYTTAGNATIFNYADENRRGALLTAALFKGDSTHLRLRFMENNDEPRFITYHGLEKTKMAAALEFSLPGIPLIYNGQEIGNANKVYSSAPVFKKEQTIRSLDTNDLFDYYQQLIRLRQHYKSLRSVHMENLLVDSIGAVVAFRRWQDKENCIVVVNMGSNEQEVKINRSLGRNNEYVDILTGETFKAINNILAVTIPPYTTRLIMIENGTGNKENK